MKKDEMGEDTLKNFVEVRKKDLNDVKENAIMQMTRRKFVQLAGATAAALALGRLSGFDMMPTAAAFYNSSGLSKFTQPLRGVGGQEDGVPRSIQFGHKDVGNQGLPWQGRGEEAVARDVGIPGGVGHHLRQTVILGCSQVRERCGSRRISLAGSSSPGNTVLPA